MNNSSAPLPRVLHVDDDDDIRAIAQIALSVVGGLEVLQCSSGKEALEVAKGFDPDIFLLDVMMPDMTGEETLTGLRLLPDLDRVPVVFMTAKAQESDVEHLMELGSEKVIAKPFDPLTLAAEVVTIWQNARPAG
ncbi:MAG: response regulator [Vannielia sp.]|uniref:response regulator n=1 Tax=Rhodobacterales TaxID=204455 RepID=UPI002094892C|nr:response regulator [Oceanicola sp. 502str15]